jgi:hypothetical protein
MTTIIDKKTLTAIKDDMLAALREVEEKHGISFSYRGGQYSNLDSGSIKFDVVVADPDATPEDIAREQLEKRIEMGATSFKIEDIGTIFKLSPRGRKNFEFIGLGVDGSPMARDISLSKVVQFRGGSSRDSLFTYLA